MEMWRALAVATVALLALSCVRGAAWRGEKAMDTYDLYVFAYSWSPEFCATNASYSGCYAPKEYWGNHFTMHGLWPQDYKGPFPQFCTNETFDSSIPLAVGWDDMMTYWPNVQLMEGDPNYDFFWTHEWTKHGTCSGLSQYDYFKFTLDLIKEYGTPAIVTANVGNNVSADALRSSFGGKAKVALQCDSGYLLSGAYTCWSQIGGLPRRQVVCPLDVLAEDSCTESAVEVKSF